MPRRKLIFKSASTPHRLVYFRNRKVRCVFQNNNNQRATDASASSCVVPHESQQGRRTDLDMEEESHTSSDRDHNDAFPLKGGEPLDFDASFISYQSSPRAREPVFERVDNTPSCNNVKSDGECLTPADIRSLGDEEGPFFVPSLPNGDQSRTNVQTCWNLAI
eukprot:scaffold15599_cov129-Skeletonema_dohrnii-CCMP3373.AAC.11